MNTLLQVLGNDHWMHLVKALLHTLWIGALSATALYAALRRVTNPNLRYRSCVTAMAFIFIGGLLTWGTLEEWPRGESTSAQRTVLNASSELPAARGLSGGSSSIEQPILSNVTPQQAPLPVRWMPWVAFLWLSGVLLMLIRSGISVAKAERIRQSGQPVRDEAFLNLLEQTRKRLGVLRQVKAVATEKVTSPAIIGVLVPTLIIPVPLLTTMSLHQIQFLMLHELAHVRRGDYLANLIQLLVESILFFNPAVWWISRQIRLEREACCDAIAVELAGGRTEYARTLAEVAEKLSALPMGALAFSDRRNSFSLLDRVQRILVPGYRPGTPLTWKALLGSVALGGLLLFVSAAGTRLTVSVAAELLTPRQRIDKIEQKLVQIGKKPEVEPEPDENDKTMVRGRIQTAPMTPRFQNGRTLTSLSVVPTVWHLTGRHEVQTVYTRQVSSAETFTSWRLIKISPQQSQGQ